MAGGGGGAIVVAVFNVQFVFQRHWNPFFLDTLDQRNQELFTEDESTMAARGLSSISALLLFADYHCSRVSVASFTTAQ